MPDEIDNVSPVVTVDDLRRQRGVLKAQFTRLQSKVNTLCESDNIDANKIKSIVKLCDQYFQSYLNVQNQIDTIVFDNPDQMSIETEQREAVEDKYMQIKAVCDSKLSILCTHDSQNRSSGDEQHDRDTTTELLISNQSQLTNILSNLADRINNSSTPTPPVVETNHIKMPSMPLPTFSGDYREWNCFHDLFQNMIKNITSGSHKLQLLKLSLKGEAASVIKHMPISDANFNEAYFLLESKYNQEKYIIDAHLQTIMDSAIIKDPTSENVRELSNIFCESVRALKALSLPTENWDCWLIFLLVTRLDRESELLWRRQSVSITRPTFDDIIRFLDQRIYELNATSSTKEKDQKPNTSPSQSQARSRSKATHTVSATTCEFCNEGHRLYGCPKFKALSISDKNEWTRKSGLCYNCLKGNHQLKDCRSASSCNICKKRHHSLLHKDPPNQTQARQQQAQSDVKHDLSSNTSSEAQILSVLKATTSCITPTAVVYLKDNMNVLQPCRALIDTGATLMLISESCAQRLNLKRKNGRINVSGIGGNDSSNHTTRGRVDITIRSRFNNTSFERSAYILRSLSHELPNCDIPHSSVEFFRKIITELADPTFHEPAKVDIILGPDIFFDILLNGQIRDLNSELVARQTKFGWVIGGSVIEPAPMQCYHVNHNIDETLQRFWEMEEIPEKSVLSEEDAACEKHFQTTHSRLDNGQYVVRLPFKQEPIEFGNSRSAAMQRLHSMENRFSRDVILKEHYRDFMEEYETLQHMEKIEPKQLQQHSKEYFLPHHGVWRESSISTKLRVVFDGSSKSSNDISLNESLHIGPKIQTDLFDILLRFRLGKIGFTADIIKMYRQIQVHQDDRPFQKILWRSSPESAVSEYELTTVTYGTSCAPFLALRILQQVSKDEGHSHMAGQHLLDHHFYVDDLMGSSDTLNEAKHARDDLIQLLRKGHFNLHKWASNESELLQDIPIHLQVKENLFDLDQDPVVKTLGLNWNPREDIFSYTVTRSTQISTKRKVLSTISRIFDPLGLLSPYIISLKILMQEIWMSGIGWDDELPPNLNHKWKQFVEDLPKLHNVRIPRWSGINSTQEVQLHCFSDASEKAYAATIYVRVVHTDHVIVRLLTAKTKVAPVKQISLPRLELCGAHLLSKLVFKVTKVLQLSNVSVYAWTDSTIVLAWLNDYPRKWSTYIGNRTSYILERVHSEHWRHVQSSSNPADLATRGHTIDELKTEPMWLEGPDFLQYREFTVANSQRTFHTELERRKTPEVVMQAVDSTLVLGRYSSYTKTIRIAAWIIRFFKRCNRIQLPSDQLTAEELSDAVLRLIRHSQSVTFSTELRTLKRLENLTSSNLGIKELDPFIDQNGLLRVGGRLRHANIPFERQHPLLLHKKDTISQLIARHYHFQLFHAKGKLLENAIRDKYWIIGCKHLIRKTVRQCIVCTRYKAQSCTQKMGDLPPARVKTSPKAFYHTGVDYAGPFHLRTWKGRGAKTQKCYIALFICMATKALHLELVTDLTSDAFIAALKRLIARRGQVKMLHSDNATYFHGAFRHLQEVNKFFSEKANSEPVYQFLAENEISWKFIPPSAPHFGGLWEAGVKSVKGHLKHILANTHLTVEEWLTVLCQVEGFLNMRPLTALSDDPESLDPLTPAHFLTANSSLSLQDIPVDDGLKTFRSRWHYMQSLYQQLWKRWQKEYLVTLHKRTKWIQQKRNLQPDDLVIIMDNNLPPSTWMLGRITCVNPGPDKLVRVAEVRTKLGIVKRPIHKLCLLFEDLESKADT